MGEPVKRSQDFSAVFGFCGGIFTSVVFQPFDVLKMALMLSPNESHKPHRVVNTIKGIISENGIRGLWKGLGISAIRNSCGAAVYFYGLRYFQKINEGMNFVNSAVARIISSTVVNPLSILETKILMPGPKSIKDPGVAYSELIHKKELFRAMSKGLMASCIKEGMFAGFYYKIFEALKTMGDNYSTGMNFLSGVVAGIIATTASHPFEIARAQIQADMGQSITSVFRDMYQKEGWQAFLKGLSPRLLRKPAINTTTFVMVEKLEVLRQKLYGNNQPGPDV